MMRNGSEGRQTERTMSLLHDPYGSNTVRVNNYDGDRGTRCNKWNQIGHSYGEIWQ